jgi:hypothetical protein
MQYFETGRGYTTRDLAFKTRMDAELLTRSIISYDSFEKLQFIDGYIFYILNGRLIRYQNEIKEVLLDTYIVDYAIDGNMIYFVPKDTLEIWVKDISSTGVATMLPIQRTGMFQVAVGIVYFIYENRIYSYSNGITTKIVEDERNIFDFLVDGILIYRNSWLGDLIKFGRSEPIASGASAFTIIDNKIYFSDRSGVHIYNIELNTVKPLFYNIDHGINERVVFTEIAHHNNRFFFNAWHGLSPVRILFVSDGNGDNLRPLIEVENPDFQTFYFIYQDYVYQNLNFLYPIGYVIIDNSGSWQGNAVWLIEPRGNMTIWIQNVFTSVLEFDEHLAEYTTELITNQGYLGIYMITYSTNYIHTSSDEVVSIRHKNAGRTQNRNLRRPFSLNQIAVLIMCRLYPLIKQYAIIRLF